MTQTRIIAGAILLLTLGLAGCSGPHFINQDQFGGRIAIPDNTDDWPTHYRSKAVEMIAQRYPQGYDIVDDWRLLPLRHGNTEYMMTFRAKPAQPGVTVAGGHMPPAPPPPAIGQPLGNNGAPTTAQTTYVPPPPPPPNR